MIGITEEKTLCELCGMFSHDIAVNDRSGMPDITVRYVKRHGEFGYARFGDFYFKSCLMYVFEPDGIQLKRGPKWYTELPEAFPSEPEELLGERVTRAGHLRKVIYAGVKSPFRDCTGSHIYTGDVVEFDGTWNIGVSSAPCHWIGFRSMSFDEKREFILVADNHSLTLTPEICGRVRRIGTLFYRLGEDDRDDSDYLFSRCVSFAQQREFGNDEISTLVRYTPNFDWKYWQYAGLELLGVKPYWQK